MKKTKMFAAVMLIVAMLAVGCFAFTACGGIDGTYTFSMSYDDYMADPIVKADTEADSGKYVKMSTVYEAIGAKDVFYTATLVIDGDNYTLTKQIMFDTEKLASGSAVGYDKDAEMKLIFAGSVEESDGGVTLKAPVSVKGKVTFGSQGATYSRFGGQFAEIDLTESDKDDLIYPGKFFWFFNTMYFVENAEVKDMTVELNADNADAMTFSVK